MQNEIIETVGKVSETAVETAKKGVVGLNPNISETLLVSVVGFLTVFVVLVALMVIISLIGKVAGEKKTKAAPAPAPTTAPSAPAETVDSYTGVKLNGVADKDAALIMAIVASKLDKPLDNLRFISIKEVK